MGQRRCSGDHRYTTRELGAGLRRLECEQCGSVIIDLDAAGDGSETVTRPGLFKPARPTIFSVLREEKTEELLAGQRRGGPRFAMGGSRGRHS